MTQKEKDDNFRKYCILALESKGYTKEQISLYYERKLDDETTTKMSFDIIDYLKDNLKSESIEW